MEITRSHVFPYPIEQCWAMFTDPESHVAKFEAMGHRDLEVVESELGEASFRITIDRVVDVEVPGFAKRVLKPTNRVRSTDLWEDRGDGTYGGTFELDAQGAPIETRGRTLLQPEGDSSTRYEITVELKVKVPLIGGRIAEFSRGIIGRQLEEEFRLGDEWLKAH